MNEPIYERMQQLIRQIRQADTAYSSSWVKVISSSFLPRTRMLCTM